MDEIWLRVAVVAVAFSIALGVALVMRRQRRAVRAVRSTDLAPGVYLFTSEGCATCDSARAKLVESLGDKFTELVWEHQPEKFAALPVDAVPSVLIVDDTRAGSLYPGQPERALRAL